MLLTSVETFLNVNYAYLEAKMPTLPTLSARLLPLFVSFSPSLLIAAWYNHHNIIRVNKDCSVQADAAYH